MKKYPIDKGIICPHGKHGETSPFPFEEMEVGDSFAVTTFNDSTNHVIHDAANAYRRYSGNEDYRVRTMRVFENGVEIIRVWRVK